MHQSQPSEFDPQWEFDCPKWRDLRRADDEDDADSWFGEPAAAHHSAPAAAHGPRQQRSSHRRAASSSQPPSHAASRPVSQHSRVKHASDSALLCQSVYSYAAVLPVRSVTPLTQPEPFRLNTDRRASRPAPSASSHKQQQQPHHAQRSGAAASTGKENKRLVVSSKAARSHSQSTKPASLINGTTVADVINRLYTHKVQPLTVRTNRSELHGASTLGAAHIAGKPRMQRALQPATARPASRASAAASPSASPCPSPSPSPRASPASSPVSSVRRITRPLPFRLASDVRAEQRRQWELARLAVSVQRSASAAVVEVEKAVAERHDVRHLRHSLVHQPLPMPAFENVFVPEKSRHTLTAPASPKLQTKLRASVGQQLSRPTLPATQRKPERLRCSSRW